MNKFVIVNQARCGSHLVATALGSHPDCSCFGEILNSKLHPEALTEDIVYYINKYFDKPTKSQGFKIIPHQGYRAWSYLANNPSFRIIHLVRKNGFRREVSRLAAIEDDIWFLKRGDKIPPPTKVLKNIQQWQNLLEEGVNTDLFITNNFSNSKYLRVFYEDLLSNWKEEMLSVQTFIGLDPLNLEQQTAKKSPDDIRQQVPNYDKLKKFFSDTRFKDMFDA